MTSRHTSNARGQKQVWLPGLQVWAALGTRTDLSESTSSRTTAAENRAIQAPSAERSMLQISTAGNPSGPGQLTAAAVVTKVIARAEADTDSNVPSCPICLTDITSSQDKAVVNSCMHVFCVDCIARWAARKRVCPLCKGRIQGYLYNIQSDTDYSERVIPPSPERPPSPSFHPPPTSRWDPNPGAPTPYLTSFLSSSSSDANVATAQSLADRWQHTAQHYFGNSSSQLHPHMGTRATIRPSRSSRQQQQQAGSNLGAAREPRPYYYRVQQQMQAGLANHAQQSGSRSEAAPVDASLAWRRNIYADSMWAVTSGNQSAAIPSLLAAAPNRVRRLQDWVNRELQALLDQQDVSIVRSFVMSLASTHGLVRHQGPRPNHDASARTDGWTDAISALQPFLHDRTAHFWHELKCFAEAPYSMAAYDRVVQYQRRSPAGSQAAAPESQQQPQHPQHAQQQPLHNAHQQHPQHAQQQSVGTAAAGYADWFQTSGWGSRWCNLPPVPSQTPHGHPQAPQPPQRTSAAAIDLTADDDSSPSPSSSSDYHIVSVQAQQPVLASDKQTHSEVLLSRRAGGMTSVAGDTSGDHSIRAEASVAVTGQQLEAATQPVSGEPQPYATAANSSMPRSAKRRRWDVMPATMLAAAQPDTNSASELPTAPWHARELPRGVQCDHSEDISRDTRCGQDKHAHRSSTGDRHSDNAIAGPSHARHRSREAGLGRGTYTGTHKGTQCSQVRARHEPALPRHHSQDEAGEEQQPSLTTGRTPAERAEQHGAVQADHDAEAQDHHHRRRHKPSSSHHRKHLRHSRHVQGDVTEASGSRFEPLGLDRRYTGSRHGNPCQQDAACDRHAAGSSVGEQEAQRGVEMHDYEQCNQPDSTNDDRWQLWQPGMRM